ncbi:hypothetical protein ACM01_37250 [Streptomyces viridochromogenes]|uniref:Uncharacterized protein n=1 Tax=Streptomyces viridochromogenes TaxID=1938 RepID=A0A0J8BTN3_STRVR|nr:hypothetical protein [Streptomyces viridochromogenes]KMS68925.1 hypothetical protein ACM01_37250 [Streptomyces viridochromogenes]
MDHLFAPIFRRFRRFRRIWTPHLPGQAWLVVLDGQEVVRVTLLDEVDGMGPPGVQSIHGDHAAGQVGVVDLLQ